MHCNSKQRIACRVNVFALGCQYRTFFCWSSCRFLWNCLIGVFLFSVLQALCYSCHIWQCAYRFCHWQSIFLTNQIACSLLKILHSENLNLFLFRMLFVLVFFMLPFLLSFWIPLLFQDAVWNFYLIEFVRTE